MKDTIAIIGGVGLAKLRNDNTQIIVAEESPFYEQYPSYEITNPHLPFTSNKGDREYYKIVEYLKGRTLESEVELIKQKKSKLPAALRKRLLEITHTEVNP